LGFVHGPFGKKKKDITTCQKIDVRMEDWTATRNAVTEALQQHGKNLVGKRTKQGKIAGGGVSRQPYWA